MKKIFFILAATATLVACDPVQEDFSNGSHITVDELIAKTSVTTDKDASGLNGNQIYCSTSAPVNAKWSVAGKEMLGNSAYKKVKLGEYTVTLTGLCADGTVLTADFPVKCETITNQLERYYIYGEPGSEQAPMVLNAGDAGAGRFSDNEGKGFPYLSDDVYWGFKTLVFDVAEALPGDAEIWGGPAGPTMLRVMNGWWANTYADEVLIENAGPWELQLTEEIAKGCARGNGGEGKDLTLLVRRGTLTVNSVYYEE